jgi:hypothetical protein
MAFTQCLGKKIGVRMVTVHIMAKSGGFAVGVDRDVEISRVTEANDRLPPVKLSAIWEIRIYWLN